MTKIVHLITGLLTGGAEMSLYNLLKGMDRTRFTSKVASMTGIGTVGNLIQDTGIEVFDLALRPGSINPAGLLRVIRILKNEQPDIVQTWLYHADFLGLIATKLAGSPPLIWNVRCSRMEPADGALALSWIIKILTIASGLPSAVVVNSLAGQNAHRRIGYKPKRWEFIPNGIDTEHFNPANRAKGSLMKNLGLGAEAMLIAHSARFHPMKDHAAFLVAASVYAKINPNAIFVMTGNGVTMENELLRKDVERLGLTGRAHLLGERKDINKILGACDLFCSSSSYGEGFSNVVAEAMATCVPCVVTDVGDSAAIVGETGIVVPAGDSQAMANAFEQMFLMDKNRRFALGEKARKRIVERFSLERVVSRYENFYTEIAEGAK